MSERFELSEETENKLRSLIREFVGEIDPNWTISDLELILLEMQSEILSALYQEIRKEFGEPDAPSEPEVSPESR